MVDLVPAAWWYLAANSAERWSWLWLLLGKMGYNNWSRFDLCLDTLYALWVGHNLRLWHTFSHSLIITCNVDWWSLSYVSDSFSLDLSCCWCCREEAFTPGMLSATNVKSWRWFNKGFDVLVLVLVFKLLYYNLQRPEQKLSNHFFCVSSPREPDTETR